MNTIEFYFDPSCPWCWITSRWLTLVQQERDIAVEWLPFSLAMKNNEMNGEGDSPYGAAHRASHSVLRVIEEIMGNEDVSRGELYTAFAKAHFVNKQGYDTETITGVLESLQLSSTYADAANSTTHDAAIQEHLSNVLQITGDDVGVPQIIFVDENGIKNGYFGPVLTELPDTEEALNLWDGLEKLASSSKFFELKRTRTVGPNVDSTAKLFQ